MISETKKKMRSEAIMFVINRTAMRMCVSNFRLYQGNQHENCVASYD